MMRPIGFAKGLAAAAILATGIVAACAPTPKRTALVVGESLCAPGRFDIYFVENQARLTEPAAMVLRAAAAKAKDCDVRHVRVMGLADATGRGRGQSDPVAASRAGGGRGPDRSGAAGADLRTERGGGCRRRDGFGQGRAAAPSRRDRVRGLSALIDAEDGPAMAERRARR